MMTPRPATRACGLLYYSMQACMQKRTYAFVPSNERLVWGDRVVIWGYNKNLTEVRATPHESTVSRISISLGAIATYLTHVC